MLRPSVQEHASWPLAMQSSQPLVFAYWQRSSSKRSRLHCLALLSMLCSPLHLNIFGNNTDNGHRVSVINRATTLPSYWSQQLIGPEKSRCHTTKTETLSPRKCSTCDESEQLLEDWGLQGKWWRGGGISCGRCSACHESNAFSAEWEWHINEGRRQVAKEGDTICAHPSLCCGILGW